MLEWCSEHPWMTFFIVLSFISALENVVKILCRLLIIIERKYIACRSDSDRCKFHCIYSQNCDDDCWTCSEFYNCNSCKNNTFNHDHPKKVIDSSATN